MSVKAFILFKLFDEDNDELVTIDEIRTFYQSYLSEFTFFGDLERRNDIVNIFLHEFFPDDETNPSGCAPLTFYRFYEILKRNPTVLQSLYLISIPDQEQDEGFSRWQRFCMYVSNNANQLICCATYILVLIGLLVYVVIHRLVDLKDPSVWPMFARIAGIWIHFHFVLAICLMLKQTMSIIRRIPFLRQIIPVDDHIDAHRFIGKMLVFASSVHTLAYIIHFAVYKKHSWAASMFTTAAELGWVKYSAPITGVVLVVLLSLIFVTSLQRIRQRPGFHRIFQYTHQLFWLVFILLVIHAEKFWKWSIGPMTLLVIEKIYLLKRNVPNYGRTRLVSVRLEDENVMTLFIRRPANFRFQIGEYVNICLPNISKCQVLLRVNSMSTFRSFLFQASTNGIHSRFAVVQNVAITFVSAFSRKRTGPSVSMNTLLHWSPTELVMVNLHKSFHRLHHQLLFQNRFSSLRKTRMQSSVSKDRSVPRHRTYSTVNMWYWLGVESVLLRTSVLWKVWFFNCNRNGPLVVTVVVWTTMHPCSIVRNWRKSISSG